MRRPVPLAALTLATLTLPVAAQDHQDAFAAIRARAIGPALA